MILARTKSVHLALSPSLLLLKSLVRKCLENPPCSSFASRAVASGCSDIRSHSPWSEECTGNNRRSPKRSPVVPHHITPRRAVTDPRIVRPAYATTGTVATSPFNLLNHVQIHDQQSIAKMRRAGRLARKMLDLACDSAREGVTTDDIDCIVHEAICRAGAYPSPLNYRGFPKSLCSSVNEVVCHGIPDLRPLEFGDVVSFDVSCYIEGVHGDNCATVIVGDLDCAGFGPKREFSSDEERKVFESGRRLVRATKEAVGAAVDVCRPGGCMTEVGSAIQSVVDAYGYQSVREYRGHGIGETFHCPPFVKHFQHSDKLELRSGMIFTIEPMLTEGSSNVLEWSDDWTVATADGGRAAQFEHTVLITEDGVEILTVDDDES